MTVEANLVPVESERSGVVHRVEPQTARPSRTLRSAAIVIKTRPIFWKIWRIPLSGRFQGATAMYST